jgi:hypothetical protein
LSGLGEIKPINYILGWGKFLLTIEKLHVLLLLAYIAFEGDIKTIRNPFHSFTNTLDFSCFRSMAREGALRPRFLMCDRMCISPRGFIWNPFVLY